jgi:class 3 adenylate cyclase
VAELLFGVEEERVIAAPLPIVWALIADSHRRNRMFGSKPPSYQYERTVRDDPRTRERIGHVFSKQLGLELRWLEIGECIENRFLWSDRSFLEGPIAHIGFRFSVEEEAAGTRVRAELYLEMTPEAPPLLGPAMHGHFGGILKNYFDAVGQLLERLGRLPGAGDPSEPPASLARRLLLQLTEEPATAARTTPPSAADFAHRARTFAEAPVDAAARERLLELVRERPDDDVRQMRPFELARVWGLPRREVLRAFLHGARAGLVDLQWQVNCPSCRVAAGVGASLSALRPRAHCPDCDVDFELDFADNVEAVFGVNPSIRDVQPQLYCASSPWFRPHLWGALRVEAGATRQVVGALPEGPLLVRALKVQRRATVAIDTPRPRALDLTIGADSLRVHVEPGAGATTALRVVNQTGELVTVLFERQGWSADMVLGADIATQADFLDLFATDAPAAGVDLSVGALTILFSDLTGTTALYERLGDARAFALIGRHFREMGDAVRRHEGALVKTMGDAVMASFRSPARALEAALEMARRAAALTADEKLEGVAIRIGLHEGPCLAVRANDRLDFFGTTVNLAARLQGQAQRQQIVILADLVEHPDVERIIRERGLTLRTSRVKLKGLRDAQLLCAIDAM